MGLPELYSALADATRLKVLEMLHVRSRPVHELAAAFDISRPAISRHLRVLKEAGLVKEVKQGRENVYSFQREALKPGSGWIGKHSTKARRGKAAATQAAQIVEATAPAPKVRAKAAVKAKAKPRAVVAAKPTPTKRPRSAAPAAPAPAPQLSFFDL